MKKDLYFRAVVVFAFVVLMAGACFGQAVNTAQIQGRVTDPSGAPVPGAQIKATQTATGMVRTTSSATDGSYSLPSLPVGAYQLEVKASAFRGYVQKGIVLQVGENPQVDVTLQIGAVSETVEVFANATMVETRESAVSSVIDQRRIVDLPLDGRQATELVLLSGAATNTTLANNDLVSTKNYANGAPNSSVTISVAGGQVNGTNYLLDGGDNNDSFSNVNLPFPFPDAIQEFSVQTSTQSARFGLHPGAAVNIVTKSGTNAFHGRLFEFIRNNAVNAARANLLGANPTPDTLKRNQFGGVFGGPVVRDKLMFFAGYQGTRNRSTPSPTAVIVPTAAARNGDFSGMMAASCFTTGVGRQLRDPATGLNFANNFIIPSRFNTQAVALLQLVPVSTNPCGRLNFTIPTTGDEDQGIARVDWILSQKHAIFGRYFISDFKDPAVFDGQNLLTTTKAGQLSRAQSLALGDTYTLTPNVVNSLHLTGTRLAINRSSADNLINFASLGVNIPNPVPNAMVLSISGYFNVASGTATPGFFNRNAIQVADDIDWTHGHHQISFGVNWIHNRLNELSNFQTNGQYMFTSNFTRDALADFFLGRPNQFVQGNPEQENWRQNYMGFYIQDNYRARSNLTLNAGLRWEPYLPARDVHHKGSYFDRAAFKAGTKSQVFTNAPPGLFYCADSQVPCTFVNNHVAQFGPRIGVVWDLRGKGRQTIRAGYGIFHDNGETFYFDRFADNPPYGAGISLSAPAGGFTNPYQGQTIPPFPTPFPTSAANAFFPQNAVWINVPIDLHPTYVQQWNLSFGQQFGANWLFSISYLGNKTTHLWIGYEANAAVYDPVACGTTIPSPCANTTNQRRVLFKINPMTGAFFASMTQAFDGADASYNGLLLSVNHRFSRNFTLLANYAYSRCISEGDFNGELTNSRQSQTPDPLLGERGNCGFDRRQIFNSSFVVSSPKFRRPLMQAILGDWQFSSITGYTTGQWLSPVTGSDRSLSGIGKDRPNRVGDPSSGVCPSPTPGGQPIPVGTPGCWFNTSAFVANPVGTFGNAGRNTIEGPGFLNFNTSVVRQFTIREGHALQVRFEAFNVLNHLNLSNPNLTQGNAQFGQIRSAQDPRILQLALKYSF